MCVCGLLEKVEFLKEKQGFCADFCADLWNVGKDCIMYGYSI